MVTEEKAQEVVVVPVVTAAAAAAPVLDVEEVSAKKFVYEGKKYLRSLSSGVVYDYDAYYLRSDHIKVGKWDSKTCTVSFETCDEEESEEDDESEEESEEYEIDNE